ncbi:hypothetical protein P154DRAFT_538317 [Amniculicola lignicola CBS 123094]|uniref:C3H1-type domain-containing protein n=1 Tax=Amniculicola lignicola CBS 123094 TaxID=1392246 RepID=A0A6A5WA78_9PLEO|nr:hypothetical protein P154DRAFT_538317 [Amniculicola lignicola CBS 123094]
MPTIEELRRRFPTVGFTQPEEDKQLQIDILKSKLTVTEVLLEELRIKDECHEREMDRLKQRTRDALIEQSRVAGETIKQLQYEKAMCKAREHRLLKEITTTKSELNALQDDFNAFRAHTHKQIQLMPPEGSSVSQGNSFHPCRRCAYLHLQCDRRHPCQTCQEGGKICRHSNAMGGLKHGIHPNITATQDRSKNNIEMGICRKFLVGNCCRKSCKRYHPENAAEFEHYRMELEIDEETGARRTI